MHKTIFVFNKIKYEQQQQQQQHNLYRKCTILCKHYNFNCYKYNLPNAIVM